MQQRVIGRLTRLRSFPARPRSGCTHHWRIADAQGETSPGVCIRCGEERQFANSWLDIAPGQKDTVAYYRELEEACYAMDSRS